MMQMERYSIIWCWNDQQSQNDYIAQSKPQIQCNPYPITNDIFHKIKTTTKNSVHGETHKTSNSQVNLKGKEKNQRNQAHWLQTIIKSNFHQNSQILAPKQKYRLIEEDRESRDKPMHSASITYDQGGKNIQWIKDSLFNNSAGKTGQLRVKE